MPTFIDLTGRQFGRWTALRRDGAHPLGGAAWRVRCVCGAEKTLRAQALTSAKSRSCGCWSAEVQRAICVQRNYRHGQRRTPTYATWCSMKLRCENPKAPAYSKYGARGITVCERWQDFRNFLANMGEKPSAAHTIDRIDNAKGYEPGNCRWATQLEQQNNRTNNLRLTHAGENLTLQQWSRRTGLRRETISSRIERGWTIASALTTPTDPTAGRFGASHG